jgi:hypothetical protein
MPSLQETKHDNEIRDTSPQGFFTTWTVVVCDDHALVHKLAELVFRFYIIFITKEFADGQPRSILVVYYSRVLKLRYLCVHMDSPEDS